MKLLKDPSCREENRHERKLEKWKNTDEAQKTFTLERQSIVQEKNTVSGRSRTLEF